MDEYKKMFSKYSREDWRNSTISKSDKLITPDLLNKIKNFNDNISMDDVIEIYEPLVEYIILQKRQYDLDVMERQKFTKQIPQKIPFVVGITGSVAVGKSTTARLLQYMLQREYGRNLVSLVTTDSFLYSNEELEYRNLMKKKGFPESYDIVSIIKFLNDVKSGKGNLKTPKYSHELSDIVPDKYEEFKIPSLLIVEGVNVLQFVKNFSISLADFFDFSIYVDASTSLIEKWYLSRFLELLDKTRKDHNVKNYFWKWIDLPREEAVNIGRETWKKINVPNLEHYILPTRNRADLILKKGEQHQICEIWLRNF